MLKRFYINLIVRMVLILFTMVLQAFSIRDIIGGQMLFTFVVLTGILVLQVVLLFLYIKKTNRLLTRLVLSVSNEDFSQTLGEAGTAHQDFKQALNTIVEKYQSVYMEKESQTFLMHHLVQAIPAGIMVVNQEGILLLKNRAIEVLLDLREARTMEEVKAGQPGLYKKILEPAIPGNYAYELAGGGEKKKLSVTLKELLLMNRPFKIILVQDISKEVDAGEIDAIRRLLRILTHEIMNSLTPVQTLTETITMLMTGEDGSARDQEQLSRKSYLDILESVQTIRKRTEGLDHFVNRFRTLTQISESLETREVTVRKLFDSVCLVMHTSLAGVSLTVEVESEGLFLQADAVLVEQVLINLVTNALTAMDRTREPRLTLRAFSRGSHVVIQVSDNGTGIPEEKLADIFMPFYSTKQQASGIGLSFVKQVLRLHNASISVKSAPGRGSTFTMEF